MSDRSNQPESSDHELLEDVHALVKKVLLEFERAQIADFMQLLYKPGRLIWANILSGIARGVGFVLGFTVFAAFLIIVLRHLGALDLPIIGKFIAEIVKIVNAQLEGKHMY